MDSNPGCADTGTVIPAGPLLPLPKHKAHPSGNLTGVVGGVREITHGSTGPCILSLHGATTGFISHHTASAATPQHAVPQEEFQKTAYSTSSPFLWPLRWAGSFSPGEFFPLVTCICLGLPIISWLNLPFSVASSVGVHLLSLTIALRGQSLILVPPWHCLTAYSPAPCASEGWGKH